MSRIRLLIAPFLALWVFPQLAVASIQVQQGDYVQMTKGLGGFGGVFYAQETPDSGNGWGTQFATFCVETREHITLPGVYYVENLGTKADKTGNVLTDLAGWVYSDYLDGKLPSQPSNAASEAAQRTFNNCVQLAIWYEVLNHTVSIASLASTYIDGGSLYYDISLVDKILTNVASDHPGGGHGVQILNLRTSADLTTAGYIQDQLVRNARRPVALHAAPEATSLITWAGLALCTLLVARRRAESV